MDHVGIIEHADRLEYPAIRSFVSEKSKIRALRGFRLDLLVYPYDTKAAMPQERPFPKGRAENLQAQANASSIVRRGCLVRHLGLNRYLKIPVHPKVEIFLRTGAFKIRRALKRDCQVREGSAIRTSAGDRENWVRRQTYRGRNVLSIGLPAVLAKTCRMALDTENRESAGSIRSQQGAAVLPDFGERASAWS